MGVVYLARDVLLERPVAIKLLAPALSARDDMRWRFLREARLAAQCFHPHIVPIHEVAEAGELAWFVMAYVAGETLAERLHRAGMLPPATVQRIGREVGWALAYAHERGVVHRDVKPENILLEQGTDRALIADFGIAVATAGPHASGEVAGTARYMAPEQALGDVIDGRADLYALGVTLHLAATGRYPHDGHPLAVLAQQARGDDAARTAVRERARGAQLPATLADAIDRCLAPHPDERFASAAAFVAALEDRHSEPGLSPEAREVAGAASAAYALTDWTVAIGLTSVLLVLGEPAGSLGRNILEAVVQTIVGFGAVAAGLRGAEALFLARQALARGAAPDDVTRALAAAPPPARPPAPSSLSQRLGAGAVGLLLAFAQGRVDAMGLPGPLEVLGGIATWLLPPLLIQRALSSLRQRTGVSQWLHDRVRRPLAERVVRWMGGARTMHAPRATPAQHVTELLLEQVAVRLFAELGPDAQRALAALPAATAALAQQAVALRARAASIDVEQRALRHRADDTPEAHRARRTALAKERAAVDGRLGATVAALEAIRVDLLRLHADRTAPGSMTEHLDAVHELQRQVDAAADVRRLLRDRPAGRHDTPHTPVPA